MVGNTRESRYLSSSDGLRMQQEATGEIAQASAQGVARIQQGQQQYFAGVVQNNNSIETLRQQLAQVEVAGASRPTALQQLSEGVVKGLYANKSEQDKQTEAARRAIEQKQKEEAEARKHSLLAKGEQALGDLSDYYEKTNWKEGLEQFKIDAIEIVKAFPEDTPADVRKAFIEKIYDVSRNRSRTVGANIATAKDKLIAAKTNVERSELQANLTSVIGNIANQSIDEQAKDYLEQAQNILKNFIQTDNGLPYANKLSIVSEVMDSVNAAYANKHSRYLERTRELQDWQTYAAEYKSLEAQEAAKMITYDEMRNAQSLLNLRYPGMEERTVQRGDKERRDLALQNYAEQQRQLNEQAGARAIANIKFTNETTKALAAAAFSDPGLAYKLKNDPNYKDNPEIQTAVLVAEDLAKYFQANNQLLVSQAQAATEYTRLDFTSLRTLETFNRSLLQRQASGQELSPTEQLAQLTINNMRELNPNLAASLELMNQGKTIAPLDRAALEQSLRQEQAGIVNIQKAIVQEVEAKRQALYQSFPTLAKYGFIGQSQDAVRAYSNNAAKFIEQTFEQVERARQEAIQLQQNTSQYGIQPNFNPSSAYATSVDGNGRVKVVPRAKAQIIKTPDGANIVTPIIAGTSAPVTSQWLANRPGGRKHAGVDFGASNGARAIALVGGQVVHIGNDSTGYGGYVDLLGDNGVLYRYAHQAAQVSVGQRVSAGDVISVANGSGAGAPHLHFEVRPNPGMTNGRYDHSKNYGVDGTVNAIDHLKQLSANASNVTTPRFNSEAYRSAPNMKVPINSTLLSKGGAVNGATYQRLGGTAGGSTNRVNGQRPLSHSHTPYKVNLGQVKYDYNSNFGYAELAKDKPLAKAFVDTAKRLGVPTEWILDIARQESGGINPYKDHNGNHYGLFGFGNDSLKDKNQYQRLRAGKIDGVGQLRMYEQYLKDNGWDKLKKQKNGTMTIADLWAFTRMGWNMRQKFWNTGDLSVGTNGGLTYADELKMLGKWVGRQYELPGNRSAKNGAVSEVADSGCSTCAQLAMSNIFLPHTHNIG